MKDGQTHLAHKAEHAVDLRTGAVVAVTVQDADECDPATSRETLIGATENVETVVPEGDGLEEVVRRQGISQQSRNRRRAKLASAGRVSKSFGHEPTTSSTTAAAGPVE